MKSFAAILLILLSFSTSYAQTFKAKVTISEAATLFAVKVNKMGNAGGNPSIVAQAHQLETKDKAMFCRLYMNVGEVVDGKRLFFKTLEDIEQAFQVKQYEATIQIVYFVRQLKNGTQQDYPFVFTDPAPSDFPSILCLSNKPKAMSVDEVNKVFGKKVTLEVLEVIDPVVKKVLYPTKG